LLADIKHHFVRTYIKALDRVDRDYVNNAFADFEREGRALLAREGTAPDDQRLLRELDMRLVGQSFELKVALEPGTIDASRLARAVAAFHDLHARTYGHSFPGEPVEIVNLRLTAQGVIPKPRIGRGHGDEAGARAVSAEAALKGSRPVCFQAADGFVPTPIFDRYALPAGVRVAGPAILEEFDSTVVVHPGYEATVDASGSIHLGLVQDEGPFRPTY
jgi:N-methylhydantoinase A